MKSISKHINQITVRQYGWWLLWGSLVVSFMVLDIFFKNLANWSSLIKFTVILSCTIYVVIYYHKNDKLLAAAFMLNMAADVLLIFTPYLFMGVIMFCGVHVLHIARLAPEMLTRFIIIYVFFITVTFVFTFIINSPLIYSLAIIYGFSMIAAFLVAIQWRCRNPVRSASNLAVIGYVLFFLCDVNVGLAFLATHGVLPGAVALVSNSLIWSFYAPSQVAMANSSQYRATKIKVNSTIGTPILN
jgi:hypothetical protein